MLVTAILSPAYLMWKGEEDPLLGPRAVRGLLIFRALAAVICLVLLYASFQYMAVGDAISLFFTVPIVSRCSSAISSDAAYHLEAAVVAAAVLKEPYTLVEAACGGLSIIGVLFITKPPLLFNSSQQESRPYRTLSYIMMTVVVLLAAGIFVITRYIGTRVNVLFFTSYLGWVGCATMSVVMLVLPSQRPPLASLDGQVVVYLVAVWVILKQREKPTDLSEQLSCTGFLATYLENLSCQMAKVGRVTLYLYVQVCHAPACTVLD